MIGVGTLETGARARCDLPGPAHRCRSSPAATSDPSGPGHGASSTSWPPRRRARRPGDDANPRGYNGRTPASEAAPGPTFSIYGNESKAHNDSSFRGFIALDIRNFLGADIARLLQRRDVDDDRPRTLKDEEGEYLITGYPGPALPPVTTPPGRHQVAALSGNSTSFVVHQFDDAFKIGDRVLLAVYDSIVMEVPDFSFSPPGSSTCRPPRSRRTTAPRSRSRGTTTSTSTVTLHLHGDADAAAAGHPAYDLVPNPPVTPPAAGDISEPVWSTNVFEPATSGTEVDMNDFQTNAVLPGIYSAWLEGQSGDPYYQRQHGSPSPSESRPMGTTTATTTTAST